MATAPTPFEPGLLAEFRRLLETERDKLVHELQSIAHKNPAAHGEWVAQYPKSEQGESPEETDLEESADDVEEYEERFTAGTALTERLADVEAALARMAQGAYGISTKTNKPLPIEQLRANPAAEYEVGADRS